jgi:hypothetical protein
MTGIVDTVMWVASSIWLVWLMLLACSVVMLVVIPCYFWIAERAERKERVTG